MWPVQEAEGLSQEEEGRAALTARVAELEQQLGAATAAAAATAGENDTRVRRVLELEGQLSEAHAALEAAAAEGEAQAARLDELSRQLQQVHAASLAAAGEGEASARRTEELERQLADARAAAADAAVGSEERGRQLAGLAAQLHESEAVAAAAAAERDAQRALAEEAQAAAAAARRDSGARDGRIEELERQLQASADEAAAEVEGLRRRLAAAEAAAAALAEEQALRGDEVAQMAQRFEAEAAAARAAAEEVGNDPVALLSRRGAKERCVALGPWPARWRFRGAFAALRRRCVPRFAKNALPLPTRTLFSWMVASWRPGGSSSPGWADRQTRLGLAARVGRLRRRELMRSRGCSATSPPRRRSWKPRRSCCRRASPRSPRCRRRCRSDAPRMRWRLLCLLGSSRVGERMRCTTGRPTTPPRAGRMDIVRLVGTPSRLGGTCQLREASIGNFPGPCKGFGWWKARLGKGMPDERQFEHCLQCKPISCWPA
jgi:hypothetical protein